MSAGTLAMLIGLLVVPALFLWLGHGWRHRSHRQRAVFWGALTGYLVASLAALAVGMFPPSEWSAGDTIRGALGFWSLVILPALGAAAAALMAGNDSR